MRSRYPEADREFAKQAEKLLKYFRKDGVISPSQNLWRRRQNVKKYMLERNVSLFSKE